MLYVGTDIIEIERIRKAVQRHPAFWDRILTPREKVYCQKKGNPVQTLAGRFAAKEAVWKCLGLGLRNFSWRDLEILPDQWGCPQVSFKLPLEKILREKNIAAISLSISHSRCCAIAVAVGEVISDENNNRK